YPTNYIRHLTSSNPCPVIRKKLQATENVEEGEISTFENTR
ncbi:unnamed protein product, partial [Rotaria magnacalcarata]